MLVNLQVNMSERILLVEDDAIVALSQARVLQKHGYEVTTVHDGDSAAAAVDESPDVSLCLMDIDLGERMNGTEAAKRILERHDIPIAFLFSHTEPEIVRETEGITSYGYIVKDSGETVLLASVRMALRLHQAHTALRTRERDLRATLEEYKRTTGELAEKHAELERNANFIHSVFESVQEGISVLNPDLTIRAVNDVMKAWYPENRELRGLKCYDVYHNRDSPCEPCPALRALKTGTTEYEEVPGRSDSPVDWLDLFAYPMKDTQTGETTGVVEFVRDISNRKRSEEALSQERLFLSTVLDTIDVAIVICDEHGTIRRLNDAARRLHGLLEKAVPADQWADYYDLYETDGTTPLATDRIPLFRALKGEHVRNAEIVVSPKNRTARVLSCNGNQLVDDGGKVIGAVVAMHDITDRKQSEERAHALVREKEYLLKEVQHRIKNTMYTMASMLSLKAEELRDTPEAAETLSDARARFQSMEVLYDLLYRNEEHDRGSVREYLRRLVEEIVDLFVAGQSVQVTTDLEEFQLDAKRLSEVGIMVNELVTNAMKYAFNERRGGILTVSARRAKGRIIITVEDDGPGFVGAASAGDSESFGMTLLHAYAQQLGGTISFENDHGTRAVVEVPE